MRHIRLFIILAAVSLAALTGCESAKSASYGVSNDGYIQFCGNTSTYTDQITVTLDDTTNFKATVNSTDEIKIRHSNTYQLSSGPHTIAVSYNGKEILTKKIFISGQSVNIVELP